MLEVLAQDPDVHMGVTNGGLDFRCQDCHKTRNHMISGCSISVAAVEGDLSCEYCHTDRPHIGSERISFDLYSSKAIHKRFRRRRRIIIRSSITRIINMYAHLWGHAFDSPSPAKCK